MKYFSCQPDSHNAFGSLINGVLTYFTVDCARYKRFSLAPAGEGGAHSSDLRGPQGAPDVTHTNARHFKSDGGPSQGSSPPKVSSPVAFQNESYYEPRFSTDTRMHIQRTLILPSAFQATQCCFSMANRTIFGADMAFIGAANGLLALVVLHEDLLMYVRGKDPQSLRDQLERGHRDGTAAASSSALPSPASSPNLALGNGAPTAGVASTAPTPLTDTILPHLAGGVPSTITWMRDKPLVLVGYSTGRVEWYRVSISSARRQELMDPEKELPLGSSVTSGAFAYQALNRDGHSSRVARVVLGGYKDGLGTERVAICHVPDAGALISSDYFPANGTVAVVGERGGLYLFHTDQLEAPLCQLSLAAPSAGFLYCHPFLPLVGVVSSLAWAETQEARRRRWAMSSTVNALFTNAPLPAPAAAQNGRAAETAVRSCGSRLRSIPHRREHCNPQENALVPSSLASATPAVAATSEIGKEDRHVDWHDKDGCGTSTVARTDGGPSGSYAASSSLVLDRAAMRMGCAITLVEYMKEAPPRQLARAWVGDEPLAPTHRLTQVLQHWIEGATPRYGTYYNFSWKFSFDLELVVGNLEEGALRVVRISRSPEASPAPADVATGSASLLQSRRGRPIGIPERDNTKDAAARETGSGASYTTASVTGATAANTKSNDSVFVTGTGSTAHTTTYSVVQEYSVRLPLHSLMNIEYISAATSALSALDTAAVAMAGSSSGGSGGDSGPRGSVATFQREVERYRPPSALLVAAAARAAADPRARLGFSASASGLLCHPANTFWAGLAIVSLPHRSRRLSTSAWDEEKRSHCARVNDRTGNFNEPFDGGLLDVFYGDTGSGGGSRRCGVCVDSATGPGLQLKENALAVVMLQSLRGEYDDGSGDVALRRHRRHTAFTRNSGQCAGADAASCSGLPSSFASTQQPRREQQQQQRRRDRDPLAPAITVPSYAARSTRNEIANAVLIAADHRVDLHQRLRIGAGNVSCVVGMNAAGEVASVPIEVRAVATWHEEGSVFVGLGPTICAADLVSIQGIERLMRRRHAAGFGVSAAANLAAAKRVGGYGSEDVVLLFTYIATLERVHVVAATGSVPSLLELLLGSSARSRCVSADIVKTQPRLAPRLRVVLDSCVYHDDLRRLLALQVLGWLPRSVAEVWRTSSAAATAPEVPEWLHLPFEASPVLTEANTNTEVERAAAIEVTHGRYGAAAQLLLRFAHRSPSYRAMATLLQRPSDTLAMVHESDTRVCAAFRASLPPWLLVVFYCLCSGANKQLQRHHQAHGSGSSDSVASASPAYPPQTALPRELYRQTSLPFWDRVALAIVVEDGASGSLTHVLRDVLLPQCNPLQALLLHHGVHLRTCPAMQEIVDCTGDFQLGACLFARVGVLTTAAALAFPFLLDGVMQRAAATPGDGLDMDGATLSNTAYVPGCHDMFGPPHRFRNSSRDAKDETCLRGDEGDEKCGRDSNNVSNSSVHNGSLAAAASPASPYAYLYNGNSQHNSRRPSPHASSSGAQCGTLESGVSHTARLVRNSALPPPPVLLSVLTSSAASSSYTHASRLHASSVSPQQLREGINSSHNTERDTADSTGAAGSEKRKTWAARCYGENVQDERATDDDGDYSGVIGVNSAYLSGVGEGEVTDEPWVWWAAAYRSFLDDEQAFVRRTTFDVECQQLRSRAASRKGAFVSLKGISANRNESGHGGTGGTARAYGLLSHHFPALRDLERSEHRLVSSPDGEQATLPAAHRASGRTAKIGVSFAPTPLTASLAFPYNSPNPSAVERSYGRIASFPHAELVVGAAMAGNGAAGGAASTQDCVCGERHEGTQLIRSLLSLCCTTTTRCSVCLEPVRLGSCDVSSAFAWCTSCRHGGHARHLQEWFRTHRRCPMNGCDCRCDEDSSLF